MESISLGHLVFERQSEDSYLCLAGDFFLRVDWEPLVGWRLTLKSDHVLYVETLYDLSSEDIRVALRLICGRVRLDSTSLLRTVSALQQTA